MPITSELEKSRQVLLELKARVTRTHNSTFALGGVSCSADSFVVTGSSVLRMSICAYLEELAAAFHKFYTFRRILGREKNIAEARLALAVATKTIIKNGLTILGVSSPESM